jgi:hypothetical protein
MDAIFGFALMLFIFGAISYALINSHMVSVERKNIGSLSARDTNSKYFWFYLLWCALGGYYLNSIVQYRQ